MAFFATLLAIALFIPFMAWGIYLLRLKIVLHEEIPPLVEGATLGALFLFYILEFFLMGSWAHETAILQLFTSLGLAVAGAALYGPMLVSLTAHVLVDTVLPVDKVDPSKPRLGPAEALERQGDHQGALHEYLVLVRIYPKNVSVTLRVAEAYMNLDRPPDAVTWFERALQFLSAEEASLQITNRLAQLYANQLDSPQDAARILQAHLEKFPDTEYIQSLQRRISHLTTPEAEAEPSQLASPSVPPLNHSSELRPL